MRDGCIKYLNAVLLFLAAFAIVSALLAANGRNKPSRLYLSSSSSSSSAPIADERKKKTGSDLGPDSGSGSGFEPIRRREAELESARGLIREALLNPNSTSPFQDSEYVPHGDIYRNPHAFHRSYLLMEKMFRIYVYEEGEPPIFHNGPCKNIYSTEGLFLKFMETDTKYRTRSRNGGAHVYFLPFSVVSILHHLFDPVVRDKAVLGRVIVDYVTIVSTKYPFWNSSDGFDHFMVSCHDWGHRATWYHPKLFFNSIRVLCNANTSEYFNPVKDASFPEINLYSGETANLTGGLQWKDRNTLAFFAGRSHGKIRPALLNHWKEKDDEVLVYESLPKGIDYKETMRRSKFCLCPSGYEVASPRIPEAIYSGCVPVLISEYYVLPFSDVLNWDAFSVRVSVKEIPDLKRILLGVSEDRYRRLYEGVMQVQRHFLVNDPPKRYDVFNMIIHSVWLRRLNVKLKG